MPSFVYPFNSAGWPHPRTSNHQAIGQGAAVLLHEMSPNSSLGPPRGGLSIPKAVDGIVLVHWDFLSLACISIFFHPLLITNLLLFYEPKKVTWPSPRVTVWRKRLHVLKGHLTKSHGKFHTSGNLLITCSKFQFIHV